MKDIEVRQTMALDAPPVEALVAETIRTRLELLCLPIAYARQGALDILLQTVVEKLIALIPGAVRGARLLRDGTNGKLLLKAHLPAGRHAVSLTLAQRAMER